MALQVAKSPLNVSLYASTLLLVTQSVTSLTRGGGSHAMMGTAIKLLTALLLAGDGSLRFRKVNVCQSAGKSEEQQKAVTSATRGAEGEARQCK